MLRRLPIAGFFREFIWFLGHHHFGNQVCGVKWGIARMPHAVTGPNKTKPQPTELTDGNPTGIGALVSMRKGVAFR